MVNETLTPNYNLTKFQDTENILDFMVATNTITGDTFMLSMLLVGFVILFISMYKGDFRNAFVGSGFIISIVAILFSALNFINPTYMIFIILGFGIAAAVILTTNR